MNAQSNFRYQPFVAVSDSVGGKIPVVDDVLSSHEQQVYPTTSLDENSIEFEFQTNRNNYTDLRQTYLSVVLKLVKHRGFDSYKKEAKKEHNEAEDRLRSRLRRDIFTNMMFVKMSLRKRLFMLVDFVGKNLRVLLLPPPSCFLNVFLPTLVTADFNFSFH